QAQERFKLVFDHSSDAIFIHTTTGKIESANREGMNMFGYSQTEFQQMQLFDLYTEASLADAKDLFERCQRDGQVRFETVFRKRDGTDFPEEVSASLFEYGRGGLIQASIRDITKRKLAEKRIYLLSRSLEQTNEAILITDPNGNLEFVNAAFSKVTGYAPDEVIGKNPRLLSSGEQSSAFYADMWAKISRGEPWQGRVIDRKRDGSFYPSLLAISPVLDDDGSILNFIGIQQDMTAYDNLNDQFLQAQKMEAVGTLVGGIAHDFNNMLAGLTGNLYLVKNRVKDDPYLVHRLDTMEDLSSHAANMIKQLLGFSRRGCVSIQPIDLTSFLKEALKMISVLVPETIAIDEHICNQPLQVEGDVTQLHQVILNLVNNARDALDGVKKPAISITLESFHADDVFINTHPYFVVGDYALLSIADNGSGISEEHIKQVYEPFFTTKAQDKGTGLGLAMVYGTIKTHQGFIDVQSRECEGTTFHIYLPVSTDHQTAHISSEAEPAMGKGETILLVDDQQYLIKTGKSVLESLGYHIRVAENGRQAVNMVKTDADIDLVIMDVVMPVMGGKAAAAEIRKFHPSVQIIFATGYDEDTAPPMKDELLICKPFSIAELSHMIRNQLDG
ncbi:MAG: PAS domain S-box protein, partial [Mariprofundus sp.]|nr:PAS domain S-box protein [Mariprofundus sp.]